MKKIFFTLLGTVLVITGCNTPTTSTEDPLTEDPSTETPSEKERSANTYIHGDFTLELPADFISRDNSIIEPINGNTFPTLNFTITQNKDNSAEQLLEFTEEKLKNLCGETAACPELVDYENVTIDEIEGVRFEIRTEGRSVDQKDEGYIMEYKYMFGYKSKLLEFKTSANDLENPDTVKTSFDEIISSIDFK